ncbi:alkaline phosphatase family protein [Snuella sedimenti]|uniref:Alkaline phosphatase family protein n=1 Tax=Snuella sedimenti TaxID=2798802 RepID=A0A8J7J390_9FLAO|nr:alkaline phosphatase family protein [Snuella sedimenti]MBJ6368947.1 alkaline phosphatase family protein [Snuella sedimenti]
MKLIKIILIQIVLLGTGCSSSSSESNPEPVEETLTKKVLLLGLDGCMPDALMAANTPNLDALMANGTYSLDARNTRTTVSGPGWSAMLTGVWEEKHGVTDNSFNGKNYVNYPHFFKYVEDKDPAYRTVSVSQWHPINDIIAKPYADVIVNPENNTEDVKNHVIAQLTVEELTAMYVDFDAPDHAGHTTGFDPNNPTYIDAIESVDQAIGEIMQALKARENYNKENWLILSSTDHGGIGYGHGGSTDEERTIFVIASGDHIPNNEIKKETTQVTVPPADNCLGSSYELKFEDAVVQVPSQQDLNFGSDQDFSIECRIRSKSPGDVGVIAKKNWNNGLLPGYVLSFKPSTKSFKVNIGDGTNRVDVEAGEITDNAWHMVSATFDRDGLLKVYVDGVLKNSASMASIGNIDNDLPFTMGADGNLNWHYNGYLAEVRMFNTILEPDTIDNWNCKVMDNSHSQYANLLGHWKLTEGEGTTILDSGPKGYNGTLSGGAWLDATQSTVETIDNYDDTPRTVDVAVTALNHLCIPIKSSWDLDGKSIINSDCLND